MPEFWERVEQCLSIPDELDRKKDSDLFLPGYMGYIHLLPQTNWITPEQLTDERVSVLLNDETTLRSQTFALLEELNISFDKNVWKSRNVSHTRDDIDDDSLAIIRRLFAEDFKLWEEAKSLCVDS